jgi:hypothetical protein
VTVVIAWRCEICQSGMTTFLPTPLGEPSPTTKPFPAMCSVCGAARMLEVVANQPLVDVKTRSGGVERPT